jgi:hypothetical protein
VPLTVSGSAMAPRTHIEGRCVRQERVKEELESGFLKLLQKPRIDRSRMCTICPHTVCTVWNPPPNSISARGLAVHNVSTWIML